MAMPTCPILLALLLAALLPACGQATPGSRGRQEAVPPSSPAPAPGGPLVVFLGDSLTAGYGLAQEEAFPALVAEALAAEGRPIRVVNAGVSGDTSAGGLSRLPWLLSQNPSVVVVGLGANDGLRGHPPEEVERNLTEIAKKARGAGADVLLLGMKLPPNYGPSYAKRFGAVYPRVAERLGISLVPFLMEGMAARPEFTLEDGLHPNAAGQRVLAANVLPRLREVLRKRG